MNRYREAMEQCAPPEGLQARLREKVCAQKPKRRKRILLAVLAAALVLCMGANAICAVPGTGSKWNYYIDPAKFRAYVGAEKFNEFFRLTA